MIESCLESLRAPVPIPIDMDKLTRHLNFTVMDIRDRRPLYLALITPVFGYYAYRALSTIWTSSIRFQKDNIIRSPRAALKLLSAKDLDELPYPPDALPAGKDISTPYGQIDALRCQTCIASSQANNSLGNTRTYELGPQSGRKLLLIHGISTPCIAFAPLATRLAAKGYRILLFDLFGRGYSDTPDPAIYPQNIQLFSTQILLVLQAAGAEWLDGSVTLVGYSLGGGIAMGFASWFPKLVDGIVLVATSGLVREKHIATSSKLIYGGLLPTSLMNHLVRGRLVGTPAPKPHAHRDATSPSAVAESETPVPHPALARNSEAALFPDRPNISVADAVAWQCDKYPGFLPAFISSIQHAPIRGQHERWRAVATRLGAARATSDAGIKAEGLREGKVLLLLGEQDPIVIADEVEADAREVLRHENVEVVRLEGGHDVVIVNADGCIEAMERFWRENGM